MRIHGDGDRKGGGWTKLTRLRFFKSFSGFWIYMFPFSSAFLLFAFLPPPAALSLVRFAILFYCGFFLSGINQLFQEILAVFLPHAYSRYLCVVPNDTP